MPRDIILTKDGLEELKQKIDFLSNDRRREVAERIKEAREFGDISENSEYDDAKNEESGGRTLRFVADTGSIDPARHRDLDGRNAGPWIRRAFRALFLIWAIVVLAGLIGQQPKKTTASGTPASLQVDSPTRLRGGLYFQSRFVVQTSQQVQNPRLVLDKGWWDNITVNSIEPQ